VFFFFLFCGRLLIISILMSHIQHKDVLTGKMGCRENFRLPTSHGDSPEFEHSMLSKIQLCSSWQSHNLCRLSQTISGRTSQLVPLKQSTYRNFQPRWKVSWGFGKPKLKVWLHRFDFTCPIPLFPSHCRRPCSLFLNPMRALKDSTFSKSCNEVCPSIPGGQTDRHLPQRCLDSWLTVAWCPGDLTYVPRYLSCTAWHSSCIQGAVAQLRPPAWLRPRLTLASCLTSM